MKKIIFSALPKLEYKKIYENRTLLILFSAVSSWRMYLHSDSNTFEEFMCVTDCGVMPAY